MPSLAEYSLLDDVLATEVVDRGIRHGVLLARLEAGVAKRVLNHLDRDVIPELTEKVVGRVEAIVNRGGQDHGPWVTTKLDAMQKQAGAILHAGLLESRHLLEAELVDFAKSEASWQMNAIRQAFTRVTPVEIDLVGPGAQTLRGIVTTRPFQGRILREWYQGIEVDVQRALRQQVRLGLSLGETTDQIARRVRGTGAFSGVAGKMKRDAESVARTAVNHVSARTREMTFRENDNLIASVRFVATLDERTTDQCLATDGKEFPIDEGPRPPLHFKCRSTVVPVLKSLRELGLPVKEGSVRVRRGTRPSKGPADASAFGPRKNGQIPADVTGIRWLKAQPAAFQNEMLGKGRAEVLRRGVVPFEKFVDRRFRPLSLKELEALEKRLEG